MWNILWRICGMGAILCFPDSSSALEKETRINTRFNTLRERAPYSPLSLIQRKESIPSLASLQKAYNRKSPVRFLNAVYERVYMNQDGTSHNLFCDIRLPVAKHPSRTQNWTSKALMREEGIRFRRSKKFFWGQNDNLGNDSMMNIPGWRKMYRMHRFHLHSMR